MTTTLGGVLRRARADHGWTLREVEGRSGIRNAHLSQIESGAIERPDTALLWTLAGLYERRVSGNQTQHVFYVHGTEGPVQDALL